jgi:hypothetical protein
MNEIIVLYISFAILILLGIVTVIYKVVWYRRREKLREEGWGIYWKIVGGGGYDGGYDYECVVVNPSNGNKHSLQEAWRIREVIG